MTAKEEKKRRQNRVNQRAYRRRHAPNEKPGKLPFRVERFRVTEAPRTTIVSRDLKEHAPVSSLETTEDESILATGLTPSDSSSSSPDVLLDDSSSSSTSVAGFPSVYTANDADMAVRPLAIWEPSISSHSEAIIPAALTDQSALQDWYLDCNGSLPSQHQVNASNYDSQWLFRTSCDYLISPSSPENALALQGRTPGPPPNSFPLSSDHLLRLIHFNVLRALMNNKALLAQRTSQTRVVSGFEIPQSNNLCDGLILIRPKPDQPLPPSLDPTYIQTSIAHSSWLNMFPFPRLRDNLIRAEKDFNHEELCYDLFGELITGSMYTPMEEHHAMFNADDNEDEVTRGRRGMIVWGESWDKEGWEVTPGFVRKWAWALRGCEDLIRASNRWRAKRDEAALVLPVVEVV